MSLIGPRPKLLSLTVQFKKEILDFLNRLENHSEYFWFCTSQWWEEVSVAEKFIK